MNPLSVIAISESATLFLNASRGAILIAGLSFFLLGMLLGSFLWGAYKGRAKRLSREALSLFSQQESREAEFIKHRKRYTPERDASESASRT